MPRITVLPILASLLAGMSLVHAAEVAEPAGRLLDDFGDADLASPGMGPWFAIDDKDRGGSTEAKVTLTTPADDSGSVGEPAKAAGECGEAPALQLSFKLGDRFLRKGTGEKQEPTAYAGLLAGAKLGETKDLSEGAGLSACVRTIGVEVAQLIVATHVSETTSFWVAAVEVGEEWSTVAAPWESFTPFPPPKEAEGEDDLDQPDRVPLDPAAVTLIAIGPVSGDLEPGAMGAIFVDDVRLLPLSEEEAKERAEAVEDHVFQGLTFQAPAHGWRWDGKKLKSTAGDAEIEFDAFLIDGDRRVPLGEGVSADPGNIQELSEGIEQVLEMFGLRIEQRSKLERVKLGRKRAQRRSLVAKLSPEIAKVAPKLGARAILELHYLKEKGRTYQIKSLLPHHRREELLPVARRIVSTVRPRR